MIPATPRKLRIVNYRIAALLAALPSPIAFAQ